MKIRLNSASVGVELKLKLSLAITLLTVTAPTLKARTSVTLVTVMETPACLTAPPTRSGTPGRTWGGLCCFWLLRHWTITNMSSIPIPAQGNKE